MRSRTNLWALPDGIREVLPEDAYRLENLRRGILDMYHTWGYEFVIPPLVEFLNALNTGHGSHLDGQTFKITDQLSGQLMGIRADMTPQIARIDAHQLANQGINRLCYLGNVLRTHPFSANGSRSPLQLGAEIFGHAGPQSDAEVLSLLIETLKFCQTKEFIIDVGHVGIFKHLCSEAGLTTEQIRTCGNILQRKSIPELTEWLSSLTINDTYREAFMALPNLCGDAQDLSQTRQTLEKIGAPVKCAIDDIEALCQSISERYPNVPLRFDLAELSGYDYHTGVVYAAYAPNNGKEIARGGRYDGIGKLFGAERPATGFSTDLLLLMDRITDQPQPTDWIAAPEGEDPSLAEAIRELRAQGRQVIQQFDQAAPDAPNMLVHENDQWVVHSKQT